MSYDVKDHEKMEQKEQQDKLTKEKVRITGKKKNLQKQMIKL